jgi:hypothetical protein
MEIGDLHYFSASASTFEALPPQHRRIARLLAAGTAAFLWFALLLASAGVM